jgi:hypothetical protein
MIVAMVVALASLGTTASNPNFTPFTNLCRSFESRDVCEEVIRKFNNTPVSKPGGEEHIIQIRYSDTHEQKMLKQQTAAARQFRAAEFEYGCLQASRAGLLTPDRLGSVSPTTADAANEFEQFLQASHASA